MGLQRLNSGRLACGGPSDFAPARSLDPAEIKEKGCEASERVTAQRTGKHARQLHGRAAGFTLVAVSHVDSRLSGIRGYSCKRMEKPRAEAVFIQSAIGSERDPARPLPSRFCPGSRGIPMSAQQMAPVTHQTLQIASLWEPTGSPTCVFVSTASFCCETFFFFWYEGNQHEQNSPSVDRICCLRRHCDVRMYACISRFKQEKKGKLSWNPKFHPDFSA